jgi:UPF0271 protein
VIDRTIDLNADLGEGCPHDERLLELVTSASVSCGAHAGDPAAIRRTLEAARSRGVAVGAHPGYADRASFGRVEHDITADEVSTLILSQVGDLDRLARPLGVTLAFVKPHGALYNQAQRDEPVARGVIDAVGRLGLPVLGQPASLLARLAFEARVRFVAEGFPERRYGPDGRLVARSRSDAVLRDPDEIGAQVVRLVDEGVATLCIHGDDPDAVGKAVHVREVLGRNGITICFWGA